MTETIPQAVVDDINRRIRESSEFYGTIMSAIGKHEGYEEGFRQAALLVFEARFGPLSSKLRRALSNVDIFYLEDALPYVVKGTLPDIRQRLGF